MKYKKFKNLKFGYLLIEISIALIIFLTVSIALTKMINNSIFVLKKLNEINEKSFLTNEIISFIDKSIKEGRLLALNEVHDSIIDYNNKVYKYNINYNLSEQLNSLYKFNVEININDESTYSFNIARFIPNEKI